MKSIRAALARLVPRPRVVLAAVLPFTVIGCGASRAAGGGMELRVEQVADRLRVLSGEELLTEYRFAEDQKYPYFYPLNGPRSGQSVTTESSEPYPHHHSLFFGADFVNGGNYWQEGLERGRIDARETRIVRASGPVVEFAQTSYWVRPGAEPPFRDERTIRVQRPDRDRFTIDFDITLHALMDVHIRKSNHSLFAARMAPGLSVDSGGTLVNSRGSEDAEGTFGEEAEWADFHGSRGGVVEGLAILNHPDNRWSPPPWFTRDYGFFSPTPFEWLEDGHRMAEGETLRLRYRVVVHGGTEEEARIADIYEEWTARGGRLTPR